MSPPTKRPAEQRLRAVRLPHEVHTEQRAWQAVRNVYSEREVPARPRPRRRIAALPVAVAIAGVLVLTPAGAAVHRWIDRTLGVRHARAALFSLPAPGRLLVVGPGGVWTVASDGSKRRLGAWREATWSPHALYVAVAGRDQLSALDLRGTPRWSVARRSVRSPSWFAPNGYRLAYLSGAGLRVIAGDGTGDRDLASNVRAVAPAWRPGHEFELAYVRADGTVVIRDADSGRVEWSTRLAARPRLLEWSADGARLLVLMRSAAVVFDARGGRLVRLPANGGQPLLAGALSPDGRHVALLSAGEVTLTDLSRRADGQRRVFAGAGLRQLTWSPDGRWLLVAWPAADQWVFIHAFGQPRLIAVSRIAQQFGSPGPGVPHPRGMVLYRPGQLRLVRRRDGSAHATAR